MNAPSHIVTRKTAAQAPEQGRYALWLDITSKIGLAFLVAAFFIYVLGVLPAQVPPDKLPELWGLPASSFMARTGSPAGWGWLTLLHRGDILNLLGIAVLAGGSLLCLVAVIPLYARRGELVYVVVCSLQVAVLLLAASGLLSAGH